MSSSSIIDVMASSDKPPEPDDANQNVEISQATKSSMSSSDPPVKSSSTSESDSNNETDPSDSDEEMPVDLTFEWLDEQRRAGVDLRPLLGRILPGLPSDISPSTVYEILMDLFLPMRRRKALQQYQTFDDAVELIRTRKNILILTGAGISVSCGIPDFRSRNGIYARLREEFPELPDPQSMFDIKYFSSDPRPFFRFAKEIWPGQYEPSLAHYFIAELERRDQLLRNYTQNIDSLELLCPITRLIQCHGSFSTATCRHCHSTVRSDEIKDEILQQKIPHCSKCSNEISDAILKPDIVFFGEDLSDDFHQTISTDKDKCDLLIVMGSSLKVKPVSLVSELLPENVPQILINRERLPHKTFDIELLGNCDLIINEICLRLAQTDPSFATIKHVNTRPAFTEVLYENLQTSSEEQPKKKMKLSSEDDETSKPVINSSASFSRQRSLSSLVESSSFDPDASYISYPPRRYVFAGAEITFSSDDEWTDLDDSDDDDNEKDKKADEELPRKNGQ